MSVLVLLVLGCQGAGKPVVDPLADYEPAQFELELARSGGPLIDVRTASEFSSGHIEGAMNFDWTGTTFAQDVESLARNGAVFLYCQAGTRSAKAKAAMQTMGFVELHALAGGIVAWMAAGLPTAK